MRERCDRGAQTADLPRVGTEGTADPRVRGRAGRPRPGRRLDPRGVPRGRARSRGHRPQRIRRPAADPSRGVPRQEHTRGVRLGRPTRLAAAHRVLGIGRVPHRRTPCREARQRAGPAAPLRTDHRRRGRLPALRAGRREPLLPTRVQPLRTRLADPDLEPAVQRLGRWDLGWMALRGRPGSRLESL